MVYLQKTSYTTAAASLINIFLLKGLKVDEFEEFKIWLSSANLPVRASSVYGLACYAKDKGLDVEVLTEKEEFDFPDYRFYRYTKEDIEFAGISSSLYKERALELGINIKVMDISLSMIKSLLLNGKLLLVRLNVKEIRHTKKNSSNFVAIIGFEDSKFKIIDPVQGLLYIDFETFSWSFESLETKKHRAHKVLVF